MGYNAAKELLEKLGMLEEQPPAALKRDDWG